MSRARDEYKSFVATLLTQVWRREGEFLVFDPTELNTPVTEIMDKEEGSARADPEWLPTDIAQLRTASRETLLGLVQELMEERDTLRKNALESLFDFFFGNGPEPLSVLERVFLVGRTVSPDHVWRMRQVEAAKLVGQSKQNWQHMEEAVIEDLISRWQRLRYINPSGKSASARKSYSEQRQGNTSRKNGRRKGDDERDEPRLKNGGTGLSKEAKKRVEAARLDHERRRLADLAGCAPEEIDLDLVTLPRGK